MFTGTAVVRNRMPGGVRGRREQSRLLLDTEIIPPQTVVIYLGAGLLFYFEVY